jgi:hypothetical protein
MLLSAFCHGIVVTNVTEEFDDEHVLHFVQEEYTWTR